MASISPAASLVLLCLCGWLPARSEQTLFLTAPASGPPPPSPVTVIHQLKRRLAAQVTGSADPLGATLGAILPSLYQNSALYAYQSSPYSRYSDLITSNRLPFSVSQFCDQRVLLDPEYQRCRASATAYWRYGRSGPIDFDIYRPSRSSSDSKNGCCLQWDLVDCAEQSVKRQCDNLSVNDFYLRRSRYITGLQEYGYSYCYDYSYRGFQCAMQTWILVIAFIILALFILVVCCTAGSILMVRKRRREKGVSYSSDQDEERTTRRKELQTEPKPVSGRRPISL